MCPHPACTGVGCGTLLLRLPGVGCVECKAGHLRESQQEMLWLAFDHPVKTFGCISK